MNLKTTLVLAAVAVAAGVLFWFGPGLGQWLGLVPRLPDAAGKGTLAVLEQDLRPDKLTRIEVGEGKDRVVLTRDAKTNEWSLPGNWQARDEQVKELVGLVGGLRSRFVPEPLPEDPDLARYGLDKPAVVMKVTTADDTDYRLAFGRKKDDGDNPFARPVYLRLDDRKEVVRLGADVLDVLQRPTSAYQKKRLFPVDAEARKEDPQDRTKRVAAATIAVEQKAHHLPAPADEVLAAAGLGPLHVLPWLLAKPQDLPARPDKEGYALTRGEDKAWHLSAPHRDRADEGRVNSLLTALPDVWVERFVARADGGSAWPPTRAAGLLAAPGLDPLAGLAWATPDEDFFFGLKDAPRLTVTPPGKKPITLRVGLLAAPGPQDDTPATPAPPVNADEYRYAKLADERGDNPQIITVKYTGLGQYAFVPFTELRDPNLATFDPADARVIRVRRGSQEMVFAYDVKDKRWRLGGVEVEQAAVTNLLRQLAGPPAGDPDVFYADDKGLAGYGLDAPAAVLEVTVRKKGKAVKADEESGKLAPAATPEEDEQRRTPHTFRLRLGEHDGKVYARLYDTKTDAQGRVVEETAWERVSRVPDDLLKTLKQDPRDLRDRAIFAFTTQQIEKISITRRGDKEYALESGEAAWRLTGPFEAPVPLSLGLPLASAAGTLRCDGFETLAATDQELDAFGLREPYMTVTVVPKDKGARRVLVGAPAKQGPTQRYAKLADDRVVFRVGEAFLGAVDKGALDLLDPRVLGLGPLSPVEGLEIDRDGKVLKLAHKNDKWQAAESPTGAFAADDEAVKKLLDTWFGLQAKKFAAYGPDVEWAKYGLKMPKLTAAIKLEGGQAHKLELGDAAEGGTYARVDDGPGLLVLDTAVADEFRRPHLDYVSRKVLPVEAAKVTALQVTQGNAVVEVLKKDEAWHLIKPSEARADDETVNRLVAALAGLRAKKVAAHSPKPPEDKDLKEYGLDAPAAVVKLRQGEQTTELRLGKPGEGGDRPALVAGGTSVLILPGDALRGLLAPELQFRDRTVARVKDDIDRFVLERGATRAVFAKVDGTWKITEPVESEADHDELEDFANALGRLRADELVDAKPANLTPYGLDQPQARWRVQAEGKDVLVLLVGKQGPDKEQAGRKEGPRVYAKVENADLVFLLDTKTTGRVLGKFKSRRVFPTLTADQVQGLRYGYAAGPFTLEKAGGFWQVAGQPLLVNTKAVEETVRALANLRADRFVADKGADLAPYGLKEPRLKLGVATAKGKLELHVGAAAEGTKKYYARVASDPNAEVFLLTEADGARIVRDLPAFVQTTPNP